MPGSHHFSILVPIQLNDRVNSVWILMIAIALRWGRVAHTLAACMGAHGIRPRSVVGSAMVGSAMVGSGVLSLLISERELGTVDRTARALMSKSTIHPTAGRTNGHVNCVEWSLRPPERGQIDDHHRTHGDAGTG
ncbi:hypothetical protein Pla52n_00370 [Stieleria varia]|uniref:Uncharacterized protein n=1 Tax=Stieleria varia TaxID=2528005 RepID=A0A5C6BAD3_9BACT|nr:hypothetical protein Pla52n_00370 [Stieleria varia]